MGNYLYVATKRAGVQIYDVTGGALTRISKTWLSRGCVNGLAAGPEGRVWALVDGSLYITGPAPGTTVGPYRVPNYQSVGIESSSLAASGDCAYLAQAGEIRIYRLVGGTIQLAGVQYAKRLLTASAYYRGLRVSGTRLYAHLTLSETGQADQHYVDSLLIGAYTLSPEDRFSIPRPGMRLFASGGLVYILGIDSGINVEERRLPGLDVLNPVTRAVSQHDLFPGHDTRTARTLGLAASDDGLTLYLAGYGQIMTAFLASQYPTVLWEMPAPEETKDTVMRLPNGSTVTFTLEGQTVEDADGNRVKLTRDPNETRVRTEDTFQTTFDSPLPIAAPGDGDMIPSETHETRPDETVTLPRGLGQATLHYEHLNKNNLIRMNSLRTAVKPDPVVFECLQSYHDCGLFGCSVQRTPDWVLNVNCYDPIVLSKITLPNLTFYDSHSAPQICKSDELFLRGQSTFCWTMTCG